MGQAAAKAPRPGVRCTAAARRLARCTCRPRQVVLSRRPRLLGLGAGDDRGPLLDPGLPGEQPKLFRRGLQVTFMACFCREFSPESCRLTAPLVRAHRANCRFCCKPNTWRYKTRRPLLAVENNEVSVLAWWSKDPNHVSIASHWSTVAGFHVSTWVCATPQTSSDGVAAFLNAIEIPFIKSSTAAAVPIVAR